MTATITRAQAFAADLRHLADMVQNDEELHDRLWTMRDVNVPCTELDDEPGKALTEMRHLIRVALAAGCKVDKSYDESYGTAMITMPNQAIRLKCYADRELVCTKRVIGTRKVTEKVPDPDAPLVTVTRTVEDVEWVCGSLLASAGVS
jgi:hypothetical protein